MKASKALRALLKRDGILITVGAYVKGNDPVLDEAVERYPRMEEFLTQSMHHPADYFSCRSELMTLLQ